MAILRRPSRRTLLREWRAQHRLRTGLERALLRDVSAELRRAGQEAADAYQSGGLAVVDYGLREHQPNLRRILTAGYRASMGAFGERVIDAAKAMGPIEIKDTQNDFQRRVDAFLRNIGGAKITRISRTTRSQIIEAILAGEAAGDGTEIIAKRIREITGGLIGLVRARVIARTETHSASQVAHDEAVDVLDLPDIKREWVAAEDARTRETHVTADSQIRGQSEAFDVGGHKLMYPGDPAGPPEEIIHCRCIAASVIED